MAKYIAIRTYQLKPEVDRKAFEAVFATVPPAAGLERVILLRGFEGNLPMVAQGAVDYVSLHVYDSPEGCARFFQAGQDVAAYPAALQPFVQAVRQAHLGETADSTVYGYTVVHGTV
jgi:hypothetical protein